LLTPSATVITDAKRNMITDAKRNMITDAKRGFQFPGNVTLRVSVPKEEENAKFNFNGQEIALRGVGIRRQAGPSLQAYRVSIHGNRRAGSEPGIWPVAGIFHSPL
jgi:hypothetical protein